MMVDDDLGNVQTVEEGSEIAELIARASVHDDCQVGIAPPLARKLKALDAAIAVEKVVARRIDAGHDHSHFLALLLEDFTEGAHGTEAVPIGTDVRSQKGPVAAAN